MGEDLTWSLRAEELADNKLHELSTWNLELLPIELSSLQDSGFNMSLLGFGDAESARLLEPPTNEGLTDADAVPEPPEVQVTQPGDMWQHEPCLMGWVRLNKPLRIADDFPHSVWNIATIPVGQRTDHPTSKPVEVFAIPMRQHTKAGDVCYEPFSGSGSQLIAAQMLSRHCYGLEISPVYCDVIVASWEAHTGQKAERVPGAVNAAVPKVQPQ